MLRAVRFQFRQCQTLYESLTYFPPIVEEKNKNQAFIKYTKITKEDNTTFEHFYHDLFKKKKSLFAFLIEGS